MVSTFVCIVDYKQSLLLAWSVAQVKNVSEKIVIAPQGAVGVMLIQCGALTSIFFFTYSF